MVTPFWALALGILTFLTFATGVSKLIALRAGADNPTGVQKEAPSATVAAKGENQSGDDSVGPQSAAVPRRESTSVL